MELVIVEDIYFFCSLTETNHPPSSKSTIETLEEGVKYVQV